MLGKDDPIVVPEVCWTKEEIWCQMGGEEGECDFQPEDMHDDDVVEWIKQEAPIKLDAISYGEDYYGRNVQKLNNALNLKTLGRLAMAMS